MKNEGNRGRDGCDCQQDFAGFVGRLECGDWSPLSTRRPADASRGRLSRATAGWVRTAGVHTGWVHTAGGTGGGVGAGGRVGSGSARREPGTPTDGFVLAPAVEAAPAPHWAEGG